LGHPAVIPYTALYGFAQKTCAVKMEGGYSLFE
jgi:hypothetical protein